MQNSKSGLNSWLISAALNIPVGIVVSFIFLTVFMEGDITTAFAILVFSIICTAGISLILWLPIWYGVGYLTVALFRLLVRAFGGQSSSPQQPLAQAAPAGEQEKALSRDQIALTNYIKKAKAKGLNRESISKALQTNGWTADSINQGFQLVEQGA
jgi:hypothetical protein